MTLKKLKESIEDKTFKPSSFIMVGEEKFIPLSYIKEIRNSLGYNVIYVESINDIDAQDDIFFVEQVNDKDIYVLNTDLVDFSSEKLLNKNNIIVIANKIDKSSRKYYGEMVVDIPTLEDWQLSDMAHSFAKGVNDKYLDWLVENCNGNVNRLYNELLKLNIFHESARQSILEEMITDGEFNDLSTNTVFNLSKCIVKKDVTGLESLYEDMGNIDVNEFGLLSILYSNFMNIFQIQVGINPTAESLGLKPAQFNAIRYNCGHYNTNQLINILNLLTGMDKRIKTGEFPTNIMIDYMILSILAS